ncbi:MAG: hypothetical protein KR126chlam2_01327 [Chlamydiae bacterium]|nr:hypothetical protein [Chlamydiota bacterium]
MELSIFLAKVVGIWSLVSGISLIKNTKYIRNFVRKIVNEQLSLWIGGLLALIIGALLVVSHNIWVGWPMIITIIGWLSLIKGIFYMVFPEKIKDLIKWYLKVINFSMFGVIYLVLGAFLCWKGFFLQ